VWNIGFGAGYFLALDKKGNVRLRASLVLFYENILYGLGSYTDNTGNGFSVNGNNLGSTLNNIEYVDNSFNSSFELSIMYRSSSFDLFGGVSWNYVLTDNENINFYYARLAINQAIYDQSSNAIDTRILSLGNYMIQVGIVREFGL
jgi:hypothetical protein